MKVYRIDNHNNDDYNNTLPRKNKDHTNYTRILTTIVIAVMLLSSSSVVFFPPQDAEAKIADKKEIRIASWNLWNFDPMMDTLPWNKNILIDGGGRYDNVEVLQTMFNILNGSNYNVVGTDYDVIFVQELMNQVDNGTPHGFIKLCGDYLIPAGYLCKYKPDIPITFAGNHEFFGVIYKNNISVDVDWTGDNNVAPYIKQRHTTDPTKSDNGGMVRPPMKATVIFGDNQYQFIAFNNHLKPENGITQSELVRLETAIGYNEANLETSHNILVLGDLNADCDYLLGGLDDDNYVDIFNFPDWTRIFTNADITNFAQNPCAYDKIIANANMNFSYSGTKGIIDTLPDGVTLFGKYPNPGYTVGYPPKHISDHKLIWAKFNYGGVQSTDENGDSRHKFVNNGDDGMPDDGDLSDPIYARGEGFVPNDTVDIYITKYPVNNNLFEHFKKIDGKQKLADSRPNNEGPTSVTTNGTGHIVNIMIWDLPHTSEYNIIVDVNQDGYFTNSIDVVDVFNSKGLQVRSGNGAHSSTDKIKIYPEDKVKEDSDSKIVQPAHKKQKISGKGFTPGTSANLFIKSESATSSHADIERKLLDVQSTLVDVRGEPTSITIDSNGEFEIEWDDPTPGTYVIVLDFDQNGEFDSAVDYRNHPDSIDFMVITDKGLGGGDPGIPQTAIVSTRGHTEECDIPLCGDPSITPEHTTTDYDIIGSIPGISDAMCPAESVVYVHGFQNDENAAIDNFNVSKQSLEINGYTNPLIGFSWDSNPGFTDFYDAHKIADLNGPKLGQFVKDLNDACADTKIRLVGHSLGARVILTTIQNLYDEDWNGEITSVHLLGGAVPYDIIGKNNSFGISIEGNVGEFHNKFSKNDLILKFAYYDPYASLLNKWTSALGRVGAQTGSVNLPSNYFEQNISDMMESITTSPFKTHVYNTGGPDGKNDGVMETLVADWEKQNTDSRDLNKLLGHSVVIHVGDNYLQREVYNTGIAKNIYTLAKSLPGDTDVDIYTISERLLKINESGWDTWENSSNVSLLDSAAPVYDFGEKVRTVHTSSDGTLFISTWRNPSQIFDQPFINYYGKKYNVIIDVNRDGLFDPSIDKVDTHDIGDMTSWFDTHDILDSSANGNQAVSEYKEYLNDKLDLENQLDTTSNIYGYALAEASQQYLCSITLTKDLFKIIQVESQVGIRVLDDNEYYTGRNMDTGRHVYDQVEFDSLDIEDNSVSVIAASDDDLKINNLSVGADASLYICNDGDTTISDMKSKDCSVIDVKGEKVTYKGKNEITCKVCTVSTEAVIKRDTSFWGGTLDFLTGGTLDFLTGHSSKMDPNRVKLIQHCVPAK